MRATVIGLLVVVVLAIGCAETSPQPSLEIVGRLAFQAAPDCGVDADADVTNEVDTFDVGHTAKDSNDYATAVKNARDPAGDRWRPRRLVPEQHVVRL